MATFAELELGVSPAVDGRYALRCRFWQPGDAAESSLGLDAPAYVTLDWDALRGLQSNPAAYGERLAAMLFADPAARSAFARARAVAETRQVPLRLRLFIDPAAPDLQSLLWETLADLDRRAPVTTDENLLFSRFLSSGSLAPFTPSEAARLRALVVIASPSNLDPEKFAPIDTQAELARATAALSELDVVTLASGGQATLERLLAGLRETGPDGRACDVLYLVAHGWTRSGQSRILLEKPDGTGSAVEVERLIEGLSALRRPPLLAVLVSCQSAGAGTSGEAEVLMALGPRLASAGVPAVLAMHGSITQPTMAAFLPVFFHELLKDGLIDRALAVARAQVREHTDWWMPVLFSRLRDNRLLEPSPLAQPVTRLYFEPETVYIPGGAFFMGRDAAEGVPAWEQPCHPVDLPAYRIGKYPLTNREFAEYVRQTGAPVNPESGWAGQSPLPGTEDYPLVGVTWYQALKYCEWLSAKTGRRFSLPSEAQWEKAARGTDGRLYPWGPDWLPERCNCGPAQLAPVGQYPPQSPYGVCDLVGSAREWTTSLWGERRTEPDYAYPWAADGRDNLEAGPQVRRVYRGGLGDSPAEMTCTRRGGFVPDKSGLPGKRHGFRVVQIA